MLKHSSDSRQQSTMPVLLPCVLPDIKGSQALQIAVHPESPTLGLPRRRIELTAIAVLRLRRQVIEKRECLRSQYLHIAHTQHLLCIVLHLLEQALFFIQEGIDLHGELTLIWGRLRRLDGSRH